MSADCWTGYWRETEWKTGLWYDCYSSTGEWCQTRRAAFGANRLIPRSDQQLALQCSWGRGGRERLRASARCPPVSSHAQISLCPRQIHPDPHLHNPGCLYWQFWFHPEHRQDRWEKFILGLLPEATSSFVIKVWVNIIRSQKKNNNTRSKQSNRRNNNELWYSFPN